MRFGLNLIYTILKICPVREKKVTFLSRQANELSMDFRMLGDELKKEDPGIRLSSVCNRLEGEKSGGLMSFGLATLKSMYHMATSEVVVLDAYWPAVSLLHHRKSLTVIQMWHAMGKIKQSGYQTLGKEAGRNAETARLMKMHRGYDYIISGGKAWNPFYCASFDTTEDKLRNYGLPRIDYLLDTREANREKIFSAYPELAEKEIILYAPTFREGIPSRWNELTEPLLNDGNRVLIVKEHPRQKLEISDGERARGVYTCPEFQSVDFLSVAEYIITDYSAIAVEAAVLGVKTLYFVYDYEEYREKNGMNIDLFTVMPGCVFRDAEELSDVIKSGSYDQTVMDGYRRNYLPEELGTSTRRIAGLVREHLH